MAQKPALQTAKPGRFLARGHQPETHSESASTLGFETRSAHLPLQLDSMRSYTNQRGWTIVSETQEIGSGAVQRPKREWLIKTARRRETDIILVWRLDRWGRSVADFAVTPKELNGICQNWVTFLESQDEEWKSQRPVRSVRMIEGSRRRMAG